MRKVIQKVKSIPGLLSVGSIAIRELRIIFSDKAALLFLFGVQIIYPIIYPVPFYHQILREVPIALVDEGNSKESRQLTRMIDANDGVKIEFYCASLDEAKELFYRGDARGIVIIPDDFSRNISKNKCAVVSLYSDATIFMIYRQVYSGVYQATATMSAGIEIRKLMMKGVPSAQAKSVRDPVVYNSMPLYNPTGGYGSYLVPAVLLIILQNTILIAIGFLGGTARERRSAHYLMPADIRENGALRVIAGKSIPYFAIYIVHTVYFFAVLTKFYSYSLTGSIPLLLIFMTPFIFACIFLGLAMCTVFRTRESALIFLISTSMPFIMISGFSWPSEAMPYWIRCLSLLVPSTPGVTGLLKIMQMDASFRDISREFLNLLFLASLYLGAAVFMLRRVAFTHRSSQYFD